MDSLFSILVSIFGASWKKFCTLLPSPVELSCKQRELSARHMLLKFYLKNVSTTPIRDYAFTVHVPAEVAKHLRGRNHDENGPAIISFSGPNITEWRAATSDERKRGITAHGEQAKSADYPLLPAGPPVSAGELDFWLGDNSKEVLATLGTHPIKLEFWGGSGTKHEVTMYLKPEPGNIHYVESKKRFEIPDDPKLLEVTD